MPKSQPKKRTDADLLVLFAERVKRMRTVSGWTQDQLAERSRIAQAAISRIEAGKQEPCLFTIRALADAFDVSIADMVSGL